jgi:tetraacyldisaccharide 4'-kinase
VGDEPQLIFQQTLCPLVAGPDRKADITLLLKQFNCDVILADDGLQHYALQRQVEICIVDATRLCGNGWYLPAGPLREGQSRLSQVDLVLYNGGSNDALSFNVQPRKCIPVVRNHLQSFLISEISGETVHAIAGIGHPQRFFTMLEQYGITVIAHAFKDHNNYQSSDLHFDDDLRVLMTEKDAIKCTGFQLDNHWSVPIEIKLSDSAQKKVDKIFSSL